MLGMGQLNPLLSRIGLAATSRRDRRSFRARGAVRGYEDYEEMQPLRGRQ